MLATAVAAQAQGVPKIGYIDSGKILAESTEAQAAQRSFDAEVTQYQASLASMQRDIETMITAYEQQAGTLSDDARQQREQEIIGKRTEYENQARTLEGDMATRRDELIQPIMEKINAVIDELRVEGGYSVIFDVASGAILAVDESLDVTPEVLRRLTSQVDSSGR
ncbi:MAG: outer membrane protein [Myxococcota bacterium]